MSDKSYEREIRRSVAVVERWAQEADIRIDLEALETLLRQWGLAAREEVLRFVLRAHFQNSGMPTEVWNTWAAKVLESWRQDPSRDPRLVG